MIKNKKAFTLVELLAVIAILAILTTVVVVAVEGRLTQSQEETIDFQENMIETAARAYANDNIIECKSTCVIMIEDLQEYLDKYQQIKDKYPCVEVTKLNKKYKIKIKTNKSECSNNANGETPDTENGTSDSETEDTENKNIYNDTSNANEPVLASGMIPVVYDDDNDVWLVADQEKGYYAYQDQIWANAVTVSDASYRTAAVGTPIPMDVINTMWVWIPRFKYKISNNMGSSTDITNPPQIDVVFENGTSATGVTETVYRNGISSDGTNTNYYTHPAFRNIDNIEYDNSTSSRGAWDEEITGFWVGKFESGTSTSTCTNEETCKDVIPIIKPNIKTLCNQNVSTQFLTSLKFANGTMNDSTGEVTFNTNKNNIYGLNTSNNTINTHMMKNTEWGAVAILSQSQYGKMGNTDYTGINKEIYVNDSYGYTGRSSGAPLDSFSSYGKYSYDDKTCSSTTCAGEDVENAGRGASTTGTIYGIYDMSGGSGEYVMGNFTNRTGKNSSNNSGFNGTYYDNTKKEDGKSFPENKYYDLYINVDSSTITKNATILGDATWETKFWYSDQATSMTANYPWIMRGGFNYNSKLGIFNSFIYYGSSNSYGSWRAILIP